MKKIIKRIKKWFTSESKLAYEVIKRGPHGYIHIESFKTKYAAEKIFSEYNTVIKMEDYGYKGSKWMRQDGQEYFIQRNLNNFD